MAKSIWLMAIPLVLLLTACTREEVVTDGPKHGEVRDAEPVVVWDNTQQIWVPPEAFWVTETDARGGLTWPQSTVYPKYGDVVEFDTFLVELPSGTCLMTFFHSRWRRANDVWRWDTAFNDYGACPHVFK